VYSLCGYQAGPRVFRSERFRLLNKKHLLRSQQFNEKDGDKAVVLARFIPIISRFALVMAGIGRMVYRRFAVDNVAGRAAWVLLYLVGGYFLADTPDIKGNFHIPIVAIILVSMMPIGIEMVLARRRRGVSEAGPVEVM
jgi:membrane-associated protein